MQPPTFTHAHISERHIQPPFCHTAMHTGRQTHGSLFKIYTRWHRRWFFSHSHGHQTQQDTMLSGTWAGLDMHLAAMPALPCSAHLGPKPQQDKGTNSP